jgi:copper chaperone CopZ
MKKIMILLLVLSFGVVANAQITKASLTASGLTCSMCSKAVKEAIEEVSFVEKVQVDIKNQRYNITFKNEAPVDLDALGKAVEDAGFSIASLSVTANVPSVTVTKDTHFQIGNHYFHFLNANGQQLNGTATLQLVDKQFVPAKDFKKYSAASKMECVQTGKAAACCEADKVEAHTRVYHVII